MFSCLQFQDESIVMQQCLCFWNAAKWPVPLETMGGLNKLSLPPLRDIKVQIVRTTTKCATVMYSKTAHCWPTHQFFSTFLFSKPSWIGWGHGILLGKQMNLEWLEGTRGIEVTLLGEDEPPSIRDHWPATTLSQAHFTTPHWGLSYLVEGKLVT